MAHQRKEVECKVGQHSAVADESNGLKKSWLKRMRQFGILNFETLLQCRVRQAAMVRRLTRFGAGEDVEYLLCCNRRGPAQCCFEWCSEACHFATRARRLENITTGMTLLNGHSGPIFDLCIVHPLWEAQIGGLKSIGVAAALQWAYRRLKTIGEGVLALGIFEVSINVELDGETYWAGEIHMTIAGATKAAIRKAFSIERRYRRARPGQRMVAVGKIRNLGYQFSYSTKRLVEQRIAYISKLTGRQDRNHKPPKAAHWAEHDAWMFDLPIGTRTLAYGCGRRGNRFYAR